jgi:hypothetical protein
MKTVISKELYTALEAIAQGYRVNGVQDRWISVENPDYNPDNGKDFNIVIDLNEYEKESNT